jgi:hypothetical protein
MSKNFPPPPIDVDGEDDGLTRLAKDVQPYLSQDVINNIVLNGDLSKLSPTDKTAYYIYRCKNLGLDPATKPFDLLKLQGKEILYANKSCAAQLRALNKISTGVIDEREWNGLIIVKVRAWYPDGRQHEDEGFASLNNLSGDALGNARLKAMTKATRRAILHLCGLGELDESEVETIPGAQKMSALSEAKNLIQIPKPAPAGSDVIRVVDIKGADDNTNTVEVLDENNRVWYFYGAETQAVAFAALGKDIGVLVDYTVDNGRYTVRAARM